MEENKKTKWWNIAVIKNDKKLFWWLNLIGIVGLVICLILAYVSFGNGWG